MSELITVEPVSSVVTACHALPLPAPRVSVRVRPATRDDIPFMDALQKKHGRELGFFPRAQMEGYIADGKVLVAEEEVKGEGSRMTDESNASFSPRPSLFLGYVAYRDRYLKRDELGIIYQLCVAPEGQRKLVGATLIREVFARSPYGCRLYCCWCAQDIAANRIWEALGFVPLAFRAGSEKKSRVHIFWQKRIRDDATPWWYPSETGGGALKESRLVLPIPPGTHWSDAKPMLLPKEQTPTIEGPETEPAAVVDQSRAHRSRTPCGARGNRSRAKAGVVSSLNRPMFAGSKPSKTARRDAGDRAARKNDPALVAKARDLRDRWLDHVNTSPTALTAAGKYDITRPLEAAPDVHALLPAA